MADGHMDELLDHLEQCVYEYIFDVNGPGVWRVDGEVYDVQQEIIPENGAAAILARRSDGARFEIFASVTVSRMPDRDAGSDRG